MPGKIFGSKREEVTGGGGAGENNTVRNLIISTLRRIQYSLGKEMKDDKMQCSFQGPEGKRPLGRSVSRWEDTIKIDPKILERSVVWIHLAQERSRSNYLLHLIQCKHENLKVI
jgi:hypothetical protein